MKCPNCKRSLWFSHKQCPHCKAPIESGGAGAATPASPLRSQPEPALPLVEDNAWVLLAKYPTLSEADAAVAQLRAGGVAAVIANEFAVQSNPWGIASHGFVRVEVPIHQCEAAQQLLRASLPDTEGGDRSRD